MKYTHKIGTVEIAWRAGQTYIDIRDDEQILDIIGLPEDEEPTLDEVELYAEGWVLNNGEVW